MTNNYFGSPFVDEFKSQVEKLNNPQLTTDVVKLGKDLFQKMTTLLFYEINQQLKTLQSNELLAMVPLTKFKGQKVDTPFATAIEDTHKLLKGKSLVLLFDEVQTFGTKIPNILCT